MPVAPIKVPDYSASKRQSLFHLSEAYETLYGGAAGGGKTAALCAEAVTTAIEYPGIHVYVFRNTVPELKETILAEIRHQCSAYMATGRMKWHQLDRQFKFKNGPHGDFEGGSVIQLAYMEKPGDEYKYQGREIQLLMFDELTHFTRDQYSYLKTRVRSANPDFPLRVMSATNPGNIGHGWVKEYFIDGKKPENLYVDSKTGQTRMFIPAKVDDHPIEKFKREYKKALMAIPSEDMRKALLDGDWDVFAGQVFTEWNRDYHVVEPFAVPAHWPRWFNYDWGYGSFAAGAWLTRDPKNEHGRLFMYREFYQSGMGASEQARTVQQMEGKEFIGLRFADPSLWKHPANADTGETIEQVMRQEGLVFQPANNERIAGKNAVHEALSIAPDGKPYLQVFSNCVNLIRTLPVLPYSQTRPEDVETRNVEDHLYDALRYGLMNQRKRAVDAREFPRDNLFTREGWY